MSSFLYQCILCVIPVSLRDGIACASRIRLEMLRVFKPPEMPFFKDACLNADTIILVQTMLSVQS